MKRQIKFISLMTTILLFMIVFISCSEKSNIEQQNKEVYSDTINSDNIAVNTVDSDLLGNISISSQYIENELDPFIQVKAEAVLPADGSKVPVCEVNYINLDYDALTKIFVSENNDSIVDTVENDNNEPIFSTTENESTLGNVEGYFSYYTKNAGTYSEIIKFDMEKRLLSMDESKKNVLPFQSRDQVWKTVENRLHTMGIPKVYTFNYEIYAFDHLTLETEQTRLQNEDEDFKYFVDVGKIQTIENWSNNNDIYYIPFSCTIMGVPMLNTTFALLDERTVEGFHGEAIVSANGIERLILERAWDEPMVKSIENIITLDELMTCIKKKFEDIILNDVITVKGIHFVYCAIPDQKEGNYLLTPVFEVTIEKLAPVKRQGEEPRMSTMNLYFSAVDGEELR